MPTTRRLDRMARRAIAAVAATLLVISSIGTALGADPLPATEATTAPAFEPQALTSGQLTTQKVVSGLSSPLGVTNAGDGTGRLFVVQRSGFVRVVQGKSIVSGNFIDARSMVSTSGSERGLLGLAFHPDFAANRQVFIFYTRASDGDIVVSRLTANTARTFASFTTEVILLRIEHSAHTNHNGGALAFGPDGYLYIGTGDGGGGGDPLDNGQDITDELLGKILRIDVDGSGQGPSGAYANPSDNPFVGATGDDEIWAYGMRNPWRISFDRDTGALYIADVGQNAWEEINREGPGDPGGRNYGWNVMEGKHCYPAGTSCSLAGDTLPIAEYPHAGGDCSITGGYVYRGDS